MTIWCAKILLETTNDTEAEDEISKEKEAIHYSRKQSSKQESKELSSKSSNASPPSSQSANVSTSPSESLDHLIDRPYVEYDPQRDDIGMHTSSMCLTYSSPSVGM